MKLPAFNKQYFIHQLTTVQSEREQRRFDFEIWNSGCLMEWEVLNIGPKILKILESGSNCISFYHLSSMNSNVAFYIPWNMSQCQ